MPRRLTIILINSDPRNPAELGAPLYQAAVAAAMDYEVEVICTGAAGPLMCRGRAAAIEIKPGSGRTVYDFIREAHGHGARFLACATNLDLHAIAADDLIPECAGLVGSAYMVERAMDDDTRVLTY
ncbi:peroxiredoxin [Vineibacter terrae]|uniref:Peroxiredoxin n=1 Tax=Vineibacter terrae TaxID=2586908 RepID=A0A5C8PS01_9HYPH|nr:DsrE family protein [Vineibacter terrae]TXL79466.1 peroxiredoxin [Vineibacter terrae]